MKPDFLLDIPLVQDICELLSGIPLAIELAAAWVDSFTLPELRGELDAQLELTTRMSDVPERHRSLRASLDWSWKLLDDDHRKMLMAISTFRGGCLADAASAVMQMKGMKLRGGLAKLIDKSWLYTRDIDGKTRFYLRDAASRDYTFQKLEGTRESSTPVTGGEHNKPTYTEAGATNDSLYATAVMAHAKYFSELMGQEGEKLRGHSQLEAFQLIGLEKQNIYEAMDSLLHRLGSSSQSPSALGPSTLNLGPSSLLLPIVRWLLEFLIIAADYKGIVECYQMLKDAVGQSENQQQILLWSRWGLSRGECGLGDYDAARERYKESLAISRKIGDRIGTKLSLHNLAIVENMQHNYGAARELFEESLAIMREIGDRDGIATSLNSMGNWENIKQNYDKARKLYHESLDIRREIGNRIGIAVSLLNMGLAEYQQSNYGPARSLFSEALTIFRKIGDRYCLCVGIAVNGCLLTAIAQNQTGAICLYGARYQATTLGFQFDPMESKLLEETLAIIEHPDTGLPNDERGCLKAQAESMSLHELAEYAQEALKEH